MKRRLLTTLPFLAGLLTPGLASAQPPGMVEWVVPATPAYTPQTDAQAEEGRQRGRALPKPEVLQPTLDPGLAPYRAPAGLKLEGTLKGAASDVLADLSHRWAAAFEKLHPGIHIEIQPPYAGSLGADELATGGLDFVFVSRELRPVDLTKFQAKFGFAPTSVPVLGGTYRAFGFLDAVAFYVHPDNPLSALSYEQLDGILSSTHLRGDAPITEWGQLGLTGEWAHAPIHVYGVKPWNGFEEFVRQRVLNVGDKRGEWRDGIDFSKTVFPVAGKVAADRFGIGYSGLAYIDSAVKVLPLAYSHDAVPVPPTYEMVATARYGLSRVAYLNFSQAPDRPANPAIAEFLRFIRSRGGQRIALKQAVFLPLRAQQVEATNGLIH